MSKLNIISKLVRALQGKGGKSGTSSLKISQLENLGDMARLKTIFFLERYLVGRAHVVRWMKEKLYVKQSD